MQACRPVQQSKCSKAGHSRRMHIAAAQRRESGEMHGGAAGKCTKITAAGCYCSWLASVQGDEPGSTARTQPAVRGKTLS